MQQLSFTLAPADPYALRYFILHSGAAEAASLLDECLASVTRPQTGAFRSVLACGPAGSGKTHLLRGYEQKARESGLESVVCLDVRKIRTDAEISAFIDVFQRMKSGGGLLLLEVGEYPAEDMNPHLRSRLLSGTVVRTALPAEAELRPIVLSLLERHNLRLTDFALNYLLRRLPLNPLTFDSILKAVSEECFAQQKKAGLGAVQEALDSAQKGRAAPSEK